MNYHSAEPNESFEEELQGIELLKGDDLTINYHFDKGESVRKATTYEYNELQQTHPECFYEYTEVNNDFEHTYTNNIAIYDADLLFSIELESTL